MWWWDEGLGGESILCVGVGWGWRRVYEGVAASAEGRHVVRIASDNPTNSITLTKRLSSFSISFRFWAQPMIWLTRGEQWWRSGAWPPVHTVDSKVPLLWWWHQIQATNTGTNTMQIPAAPNTEHKCHSHCWSFSHLATNINQIQIFSLGEFSSICKKKRRARPE